MIFFHNFLRQKVVQVNWVNGFEAFRVRTRESKNVLAQQCFDMRSETLNVENAVAVSQSCMQDFHTTSIKQRFIAYRARVILFIFFLASLFSLHFFLKQKLSQSFTCFVFFFLPFLSIKFGREFLSLPLLFIHPAFLL